MPVAILNRNRIQDQLDANLTLGAGTDGYAIVWDNATGKFVMAAAGGSSLPVVDETALVYKTGNAAITATLDANNLTTARTYTLPDVSSTVAVLGTAQTFTAAQTCAAALYIVSESTSAELDVSQYKNSTGDYPKITTHKSGGTAASPAQTISNMILYRLSGYGWNSTDAAWYEGTRIESVSTWNWGGVGQGVADLVFSAKKNENVSPVEILRLVGSTGTMKLANIQSNADVSFSSPYDRSTPMFVVSGTNTGGVDLSNTGVKISAGCKTSGVAGTYLFEVANANQSTIYNLHGYGYAVQTLLDGRVSSSGITSILELRKNLKSGTPIAGMGVGINLYLQSSTTVNQDAARLVARWNVATHASRSADLIGYASDYGGEREIWRGRASGTAPQFAVLGATPVSRQAHIADPSGGGTQDAEARTAINAILDTLEAFGFNATS